MAEDYELIDSGDGRKFERFGRYTLVRPCSQALWLPRDRAAWERATATFDREDGNRWHGRGANGEMYKIERDLQETIDLVKGVLSETPLFVLFSSHTPGLSCIVAENIISQAFPSAKAVESGEMLLEGRDRPCPSGIYCRAVF